MAPATSKQSSKGWHADLFFYLTITEIISLKRRHLYLFFLVPFSVLELRMAPADSEEDSDQMRKENEAEEEESETAQPSSISPQSAIDLQDIMESIARITLAGFGGSIVGLSLEHRLQSMRVTTAAGLSAAARRKRSPLAAVNLPITWGISCMVFCSIVEVSRLTSPSSILLRQMGWQKTILDDYYQSSAPSTTALSQKQTPPPPITIVDYTIGGFFAGLAGSVGRHLSLQRSSAVTRIPSPGKYFGVGPGLGLGLLAGCIQAAADYGVGLAEQRLREHQQG